MKVTVCELSDRPEDLVEDWKQLAAVVKRDGSDLVLLPEMPFGPWLFGTDSVNEATWNHAVEAHRYWPKHLEALGSAMVLTTLPVNLENRKLNQAAILEAGKPWQGDHCKAYLPDEPGFWEASWYDRAPPRFQSTQLGSLSLGFLICTELWFQQYARSYGQQGVHVLAVPRCTGKSSLDKWLMAGRTAGIVAGAFCISSNRVCRGDGDFGGRGWITGPEGEILAVTTPQEPVVTVTIDLVQAEAAKANYPRYVKDWD